ncbi:uncharacterized protein UBRO_20613 [Ustilago bromivora]|uniref:Secreted protein n=1 Tax=Ustilago bromivora TaxID=307758 RepID=A0A1K0HBX4_9BASI|nr:uncharacterized protein UBRO_20613 [Ustilago bromivora]
MCNLQLASDLRLLWSIVQCQCISTLILARNNNTVSSIQPQPPILLFFDRQLAAHTAHESAWTTCQAILRRISTQSEVKRRTVCISVKPLRRWNAKFSMRSFLSFFFSSPPLNWLVFLSVRSLSAPLPSSSARNAKSFVFLVHCGCPSLSAVRSGPPPPFFLSEPSIHTIP